MRVRPHLSLVSIPTRLNGRPLHASHCSRFCVSRHRRRNRFSGVGGHARRLIIRRSVTPITWSIHPRIRSPRLNRKIKQGFVQLHFEDRGGYLQSVLEALNVSIESQIAVFSKTSLQAPLIEPNNPRTIFFNDSVAWMRGGFNRTGFTRSRSGDCLSHAGAAAGKEPGVRSPGRSVPVPAIYLRQASLFPA
jgi:hypothetical protein